MVPEVVGTMGMSSASVGMDQGIWNWGANSRMIIFLEEIRIQKSQEIPFPWFSTFSLVV